MREAVGLVVVVRVLVVAAVGVRELVAVMVGVKELVAVTLGVPLGVATSRPAGRHGSATPPEENAAGTAA